MPLMRPHLLRIVRSVVLVSATSLLVVQPASPALASPVPAGNDYFETQPGTFQDFSMTPIPADFFDPGSDPFTGVIDFLGLPIDPATLGTTDTIVERKERAHLPGKLPSTDTIPIEIVALSLVSVNPITVTYNGGQNPEFWDVNVGLSTVPQLPGSMTLEHTTRGGGTFDSVLPVTPRFTFTRVNDGAVRVLDLGDFGQHIQFQAHGVPWSHDAEEGLLRDRKFCASCVDGMAVTSSEFAIIAQHLIRPAMQPMP